MAVYLSLRGLMRFWGFLGGYYRVLLKKVCGWLVGFFFQPEVPLQQFLIILSFLI